MGNAALPGAHSAIIRAAIRLSQKRGRQVWIIWTGRRVVAQVACRRGQGILIARVIGDTIIPFDVTHPDEVEGGRLRTTHGGIIRARHASP